MRNVFLAIAALAMVQTTAAAQSFEFDFGCATQAVIASTQHQCRSPGRFGCYLEKAGVGFAAYMACSNQAGFRERALGRFRSRIQIRRAARRSAFRR